MFKLKAPLSYIEKKNSIFFNNKKCIFWCIFLFCFLPTYKFDFNKWGLKLNFMIRTTFLSQKNLKQKLKYDENEKNRKISGRGACAQNFINFKAYYFSEKK